MRKAGVSLFVLAVILTALAACGGNTPASTATINVSLTTFGLQASAGTIKAGEITFKVRNDAGDLVHEFVIIKTDVAADKLPMNANGQTADEEKMSVVNEIEDIQPGKSGELKVNLAAGHYVILCNIEGHYMAGMRADLTVQ